MKQLTDMTKKELIAQIQIDKEQITKLEGIAANLIRESKRGVPKMNVGRAEIIEVIRLHFCRGLGNDCDPSRTVIQHWTTGGEMIGDSDPYEK